MTGDSRAGRQPLDRQEPSTNRGSGVSPELQRSRNRMTWLRPNQGQGSDGPGPSSGQGQGLDRQGTSTNRGSGVSPALQRSRYRTTWLQPNQGQGSDGPGPSSGQGQGLGRLGPSSNDRIPGSSNDQEAPPGYDASALHSRDANPGIRSLPRDQASPDQAPPQEDPPSYAEAPPYERPSEHPLKRQPGRFRRMGGGQVELTREDIPAIKCYIAGSLSDAYTDMFAFFRDMGDMEIKIKSWIKSHFNAFSQINTEKGDYIAIIKELKKTRSDAVAVMRAYGGPRPNERDNVVNPYKNAFLSLLELAEKVHKAYYSPGEDARGGNSTSSGPGTSLTS